MTTPIPIPASLEPQPRSAVLPTSLAAARASVLLCFRVRAWGGIFFGDFLLVQQALTLYPVWLGLFDGSCRQISKAEGNGAVARGAV